MAVQYSLAVFVACLVAVVFFRAADYEHMNPYVWALASLGVSGVVELQFSNVAVMVAGQAALFALMAWINPRRFRSR